MYGEVTYITRTEYADRDAMMTKHAQRIMENSPDDIKVGLNLLSVYVVQLC